MMTARLWTKVVVAVSGATMALSLQAGGADAAPRVQVSTTSLVLADGAAVAVPVRVSCDPGTPANLSVTIAQRSGRQIASAFGNEGDLVCDGNPRVVQVFLPAQALAFFPGVAFVTANLSSCTFGPFPPFLAPTSACSARASRTTRLVPGMISEDRSL